jgi:molybdopterin molybdotransferase
VRLRVVGKVPAGQAFKGQLKPGTCVRLFTGSPLPGGADAVVMQEDTRQEPQDPESVLFLESEKRGGNVRVRGEDIKCGFRIAEPGARVDVGLLSLFAALGIKQLGVGRQPVVAILATGSELVEPGGELGPGRIYESNRLALATLARRAGSIPKVYPLVPDTLAGTRESLSEALNQCDIVITSGGVSVGEMDFIKQAFEACGGQLEFWKVAIKPGRPFVFGRLGKKLLFGLPGNPVSAFVTFLLLARPALLRFQGASNISLPGHSGILSETLSNPGDRRHFMRVRVDAEGKVSSAGLQQSHVLSSLAQANGLVDVPPRTSMAAGSVARVLVWESC